MFPNLRLFSYVFHLFCRLRELLYFILQAISAFLYKLCLDRRLVITGASALFEVALQPAWVKPSYTVSFPTATVCFVLGWRLPRLMLVNKACWQSKAGLMEPRHSQQSNRAPAWEFWAFFGARVCFSYSDVNVSSFFSALHAVCSPQSIEGITSNALPYINPTQ